MNGTGTGRERLGFIVVLAFKNLLRYGRRTIITTIAIAVGIAVYILADSVLVGVADDSERNLVSYETGAAQIMTTARADDLQSTSLKDSIPDAASVASALSAKLGGGVRATPELVFAGEMFFGEGSQFVRMIAIDPQTQGQVFDLADTVGKGSFLDPAKPNEPALVVGSWLAQDLGVSVGDLVTVRTRTRDGAYQTISLELSGIIDSPDPIVNKGTGFIPIAVAQDALNMPNAATNIVLGFPSWKDPAGEIEQIRSSLGSYPGLSVLSWRDLAQDYLAIAQAKTAGSSVILFFIFVIAAVGISNTMLMAVFERVREIGMMRALGMSDRSIRLAFLFEAGGIGLIGSVAGLALGALINLPMVNVGINISGLIGQMDIGYRIAAIMRGSWNIKAFVSALVLGVLASMVIALIPSGRALKMKITDCLRHT